MDLTVDSFRALARSSPWRWTSLHLTHRSSSAGRRGAVEAWLTRPDGVRVVDAEGRPLANNVAAQRPDGSPSGPWRPGEPTYGPDGLVTVRPGGWSDDFELGQGLFWENYTWVAMLDPVELARDVDVGDLRVDEVAGRPAWRARLVAQPGYEPRCGGNCCELLWSEAGLMADFSDPDEVPWRWRGKDYPDAYDVSLDVATGVVVRCHPVGGDPAAPWLENDIHSHT